jgi:membrane associated rhomboid family serine protease
MKGIWNDLIFAFRKNNNQVVQLILACVFLFFFKFFTSGILSFFENSALYQSFLQENLILSTQLTTLLTHPWTLFFFPFTNLGFLSLLFNCLALYWFGNLLTDFLGGRKMFTIFFIGAIFSAVFYLSIHYFVLALSKNPVLPPYIYGASAGIYAVLFASVALLPDYELSFFRLFVKLKYLALAFLLISFLSPSHGILNFGGAAFGYLHVKFLRTGWNVTSPFESLIDWFGNLKKPKKKPSPFKSFSKTPAGEFQRKQIFEDNFYPNQEEVDHLLDKISINGYDSLTKDEKQRLFKASQKKD